MVVDGFGYAEFFVVAAVLGIPSVVLVLILMRHQNDQQAQPERVS